MKKRKSLVLLLGVVAIGFFVAGLAISVKPNLQLEEDLRLAFRGVTNGVELDSRALDSSLTADRLRLGNLYQQIPNSEIKARMVLLEAKQRLSDYKSENRQIGLILSIVGGFLLMADIIIFALDKSSSSAPKPSAMAAQVNAMTLISN